MLWVGWKGPCWWSYFYGEVTDADAQQYIDEGVLKASKMCKVSGVLALTMVVKSNGPTRKHMELIGAAIKAEGGNETLPTAHAMYLTSYLARAALMVLNKIVYKAYPERIFSSPIDALKWLSIMDPRINPVEIVEDIKCSVPDFAIW
jgi:hypothetical protein